MYAPTPSDHIQRYATRKNYLSVLPKLRSNKTQSLKINMLYGSINVKLRFVISDSCTAPKRLDYPVVWCRDSQQPIVYRIRASHGYPRDASVIVLSLLLGDVVFLR